MLFGFRSILLNFKARSVDISPDGIAYAVGTMGGVLHIAKLETKVGLGVSNLQSQDTPLQKTSMLWVPREEYFILLNLKLR